MTTEEASPKCPYASHLEEASEDESLLQSCPAFEKSCPFAGKSPEEIQQQLLNLPESHLKNQIGNQFKHMIQNIHETHPESPQFKMECPVSSKMPMLKLSDLEGYSLVEIMAQMAQKMDRNQENLLQNIAPQQPEISTHEQQQQQKQNATLSESFKYGTAAAHQAAEDVHFVANFIRGEIDRHLYGKLVIQLYYVYQALEDTLHVSDPNLEQFSDFHRVLARKESLLEDLDYWHTNVTQILSGGEISPATKDYVDRLYFVRQTNPLLLLSHSYTRYLGDLSGGKILARVAKRAMDCDGGLSFYNFESIPSAKKFKDQYRAKLDSLNLSAEQIQQLVGEANVAFVLNVRMFEELDVLANVPNAKVRPLSDALQFSNQPTTIDKTAECPFLENKKKQPTAGRCPWPFIILHDPKVALQDWQTWAVIGLVLCYIYSKL